MFDVRLFRNGLHLHLDGHAYLSAPPDSEPLAMNKPVRPVCPFCDRIENGSVSLVSTELCVAFEDAYPLSRGHLLIVSRRHVERLRDLSPEEHRAMWDLIPAVQRCIEGEHNPDGYNVGLNDGVAAGQTVPHVHLHVIPRYAGDTSDPRGGVRWVVPARAAYWKWKQ